MGNGLWGVAIGQLLVFIFVLALAVRMITTRIAYPSLQFDMGPYRHLLRAAFPFALSSIFIFFYNSVDVILISIIKGDAMTGIYSGASSFVQIFLLIPSYFVGAILPQLSKYGSENPRVWNRIFQRMAKYLLIMALPIAVGLVLLSNDFVGQILGSEYKDASVILQVISWVIIITFMNHGFSNALISIDQETALLRVTAMGMVLNLVCNLMLIPPLGALGAAVTSVLSEAFRLVAQVILLYRRQKERPMDCAEWIGCETMP